MITDVIPETRPSGLVGWASTILGPVHFNDRRADAHERVLIRREDLQHTTAAQLLDAGKPHVLQSQVSVFGKGIGIIHEQYSPCGSEAVSRSHIIVAFLTAFDAD